MRITEGTMPAITQKSPARVKEFGTLWVGGPMSALEQACLNSFSACGQHLTVFSYDTIPNLPNGVSSADAAEIVPREYIQAFRYDGRPDIAHFADFFRLVMIEKAALCWVDTDIVFIGNNELRLGPAGIFGKEKTGTINNAVLFIEDSDLIRNLRRRVEALMHKNLTWGETGPLLLHQELRRSRVELLAEDFSVLYPIGHDDIVKVFLPEHYDWCEAACSRAATLHLFNNVILRMGYWKLMAPPANSFLHSCLKKTDGLRFFVDVFPDAVMRQIVCNFKASQTGSHVGFKAILKQFFPGLRRSLAHHARRQRSEINFLSATD